MAVKEEIAGFSSIVEYYFADPGLATITTKDELKEIFKFSADEWGKWREVMLYQGFNPRHILRLMKSSATAWMAANALESVTLKVNYNGADVDVTWTNHQVISLDVQILIEIFGTRGATWTKLKGKSTEMVKTYLTWMEAKYNFETRTNAAGTALGADVITIARVIGCFPHIVCHMYQRGVGRVMFDIAESGLGDAYAGPRSILSPFFCSVIPREYSAAGDACHYFFFLIHVLVDDVVHKKTGDFTSLESMIQYYLAAYRSEATPRMSRILYCQNNVITTGGKFIQAIIDANADASNRIRALRPNDPQLNVVLQDLASIRD